MTDILGRKIRIGDRIKFRVVARWADRYTAWRVVKTVETITTRGGEACEPYERITVRCGGWPDYVVREHELLDHVPKEEL